MIDHDFASTDVQQPQSWAELCRIEPRLIDLEQAIRRELHRDDQWPAYESMKRRLRQLVGWDCRNQLLRHCACYDVAHRYLLDLLEGVAE